MVKTAANTICHDEIKRKKAIRFYYGRYFTLCDIVLSTFFTLTKNWRGQNIRVSFYTIVSECLPFSDIAHQKFKAQVHKNIDF